MALPKASSIVKYSLNLGIRGASVGLRFLFALFLGRYFPPEVLGEYGLFATTILVSYLVLSLSFDSYAVREILSRPKQAQGSYVRNVFVFFFVAFVMFTAIAAPFLNDRFISNELIVYFVVLLFLETIIQILFALFTSLQMPTDANVILFLSQGSWILIVLAIWYVNPGYIDSLEAVMLVWILGSASACVQGIIRLVQYYKGAIYAPVDLKWIRAGLSISLIFFCSSLGYKAIEYLDRYFIEYQLGAAELGVYIFFSQIANLMNVVINVTVILMLYPRLIEFCNQRDYLAYTTIKKKMRVRILIIGACVAIGATIFMKLALVYIGKESFYDDVLVFYVLLASNLVMNLSFVSHYCLYAMHKDIPLVLTTLAGSVCCGILNFFLIDQFGIVGAAIATGSSFALIWILKSFYVSRYEPTVFS